MTDEPMIERQDPGFIFNRLTQCFVRNVAYDFATKHGVLYMNDDSCTDWSGVVTYFTNIDQDVARIDTVAGDVLDTVYFRNDDGEWESRTPPEGLPVPNPCRDIFEVA